MNDNPDASPPTLTDLWRFFGPAYVLNLDSDVERMKRASERLRRANVEYERVPGIVGSGPNAGNRGCALTHRRTWERALQVDCERFLVFEDDVVLRDDIGNWLPLMIEQLQTIEWDVFYLGLHLMIDGGLVTANLGRVAHGYHAHAYVVQSRAVPRLQAWLDRYESEGHFDFDGFCDSSLRKVYASPILAVQEPGYSHAFKTDINRLPQYFDIFGPFDRDDFRCHCHELRDEL